jgi:hypothetical protein
MRAMIPVIVDNVGKVFLNGKELGDIAGGFAVFDVTL